MTTKEVAEKHYEFCSNNDQNGAIEALYHQDIVSIEPEGTQNRVIRGLDAVRKKSADFQAMVEEVHGGTLSEPVVSTDHFTVSMSMDVSFKEGGRMNIDEICVYEVKDGKIIREEFFFKVPS